MNKYLLIFLLLSYTKIFSQDLLVPFKTTSVGSHKHTNKDKSFFSKIDSEGNIIISASTERDSTFTDLLTTKLDPNLKVIWQKRKSIATKLSIDFPRKTFVDAQNNIYTVGVSIASDASESNGILFVVKYDTMGNLLWEFSLDDLKEPKNYNYLYQNSFLDDKNILHIIYGTENAAHTGTTFDFYAIGTNGEVIEKFTRNDLGDEFASFTGLSFDFTYKEGNYYLKYSRQNVKTYENEYFLKIINNKSVVAFPFTSELGVQDYFFNSGEEIQISDNNELYLFNQYRIDKKFKLIKTNASGAISFAVNSPSGFDHIKVLAFINAKGNYCVLNNKKATGSTDLATLNLIEYDAAGNVVNNSTVNSTYVFEAKRFSDDRILVLTENGRFKLFTESLVLINEFIGSEHTINDFCKVDDSTLITAQTSNDKMFPNSDFYSELNIHINKISPVKILNTYSYSGVGTSLAYNGRIVIDSKNNYYVARIEDYGDTNNALGGTHAPQKYFVDKYDSDLKLIWTLEIPKISFNNYDYKIFCNNDDDLFVSGPISAWDYELLKVSKDGKIIFQVPSYSQKEIYFDKSGNLVLASNPSIDSGTGEQISSIFTFNSNNGLLLDKQQFPSRVEYWGSFISKNGESFAYMYSEDYWNYTNHPKLYIYKNKQLDFVVNLNISTSDGKPYNIAINNEGTLFFSTGYTKLLHKVSLDNKYSFVNVNDVLTKMVCTAGGKIFAFNEKGNISIFDNALSLYGKVNNEFDSYRFISVLQRGNKLIATYMGNFNEGVIKIIDEYGNVINTFRINEYLPLNYFDLDSNNDLVAIGGEGQNFRQYFDYRWSRGFVHKYELEQYVLKTDDFNKKDLKLETLNVYPNPTKSIINIQELSDDSIKTVKIFDINGCYIESFYNSKIDISNLIPAVYLIKIVTQKGRVFTKKIIKE